MLLSISKKSPTAEYPLTTVVEAGFSRVLHQFGWVVENISNGEIQLRNAQQQQWMMTEKKVGYQESCALTQGEVLENDLYKLRLT